MPAPDLNDVLRDAAIALAALYPGCRGLRIVGETFDGQPLTLPVPAGVFVPHGARQPLALPVEVEPINQIESDGSENDDGALDDDELKMLRMLKKTQGSARGDYIAEHEDVAIPKGTARRKLPRLVRLKLVEKTSTGYRISELGKSRC